MVGGYFSIEVYEDRFGVKARTVHRWVEDGILERKRGKGSHRQRYRFRDDIACYLREEGAMNKTGMMDRELLHPVKVAREMGVSKATVYRWFHEERFGGIKLGDGGSNGMVRIFKDDFERYLRSMAFETQRERWKRGREGGVIETKEGL
jgi:predicted site-specific integrase-resolvase